MAVGASHDSVVMPEQRKGCEFLIAHSTDMTMTGSAMVVVKMLCDPWEGYTAASVLGLCLQQSPVEGLVAHCIVSNGDRTLARSGVENENSDHSKLERSSAHPISSMKVFWLESGGARTAEIASVFEASRVVPVLVPEAVENQADSRWSGLHKRTGRTRGQEHPKPR